MPSVEVASGYVSLYPKFAAGFSSQIRTDLAQASKASGLGTSSDPFTKASEDSGKKSGKSFGSGFSTAAKTVLTGAAVLKVVDFLGDAKESFSELEDATAAAGVVFGDSMNKIIDKSKTAATTIGMSRAQVIDAANTFGTLGKSARLSGDNLATFSNDMTDVAGSLSSFKGGTPEEAVLAVGAALRGESEPIRRYGILLDDATLRQRALTLGIVANIKTALTPQQRVLAAQAEILAQSTDAMGDFARTADSTANVQKTLAAESANLSAEIGEKVAPMFVAAQRGAAGFLGVVSDNLEILAPLAGAMGTVAAAVGGFVLAAKGIEALKAAKATLVGLGDAFQAMGTKAKIATASAGAIGIALVAASAAYGLFADKTAKAQQAVDDYTQALEADNLALGTNVRATIAKRLEDDGALKAAQDLGIGLDLVTDAVLGQGDAMKQVKDAIAAQNGQMGEQTAESVRLGEAASTLSKMLGTENQALQDGVASAQRKASAIGESTTATETDTTATKGNTSVLDTNTGALKTNTEKIKARASALLQTRSDHRGFEAAVDAATESLKTNGKTLDINTEKGRANQEALDGIATKGEEWVQSLRDQDAPQEKVNAAVKESRKSFIDAATAMGMSKDEAAKLATKLGLVKDDATKAKDKLLDLNRAAKKLDGTNIKFSVSAAMNKSADEIEYFTTGHGTVKFSARAGGGWAQPGLVLRGEKGPELTYESRPTYTYTAEQTKEILSGGSTPSSTRPLVQVNGIKYDAVEDFVAALTTSMASAERRQALGLGV